MKFDTLKKLITDLRAVSAQKYYFSTWRYATNRDHGEHRLFFIKMLEIASLYFICTCLPANGLPQIHPGDITFIYESNDISKVLLNNNNHYDNYRIVINMVGTHNVFLSR